MPGKEPIAYQPFDGDDGIDILDGYVRAMRGGKLVASQRINEWQELGDLLNSYGVLTYLPNAEFSFNGERLKYDIVVTMEYIVGVTIHGWLWINQHEFPWSAEWIKDPIFRAQRFLPDGVRDYAKNDPDAYGWEIDIPPAITRHPDKVMVKRLLTVIEKFLYDVESRNEKAYLLYSKHPDNVMSHKKPMWSINLPKRKT